MDYVNLDLIVRGKCHLCGTCKRHLKRKKMPPLCFANKLKIAERPSFFKDLKGLEKQLIRKSLPFLKIRQLPKTGMEVLNDRIVNVPISDDDIVKTVTSLPRTSKNDGTINLQFKRKLEYKTYYKAESVRLNQVYDALWYLKNN